MSWAGTAAASGRKREGARGGRGKKKLNTPGVKRATDDVAEGPPRQTEHLDVSMRMGENTNLRQKEL